MRMRMKERRVMRGRREDEELGRCVDRLDTVDLIWLIKELEDGDENVGG